jgi:hypothetical protein
MKLLYAALLVGLVSPLALAAPPSEWTVSVQQGPRVIPRAAPATIKRAPFELVFEGTPDLGYAVLASTHCEDLVNLKTPEQITPFTKPFALTAEAPNRENRFLVVNNIGAIPAHESQWQMFAEDAEDKHFSFQKFVSGKDGKAIARREINEIFMIPAGKTETAAIPVSLYASSNLCLLITGLPNVGYLAHTEPKLLRIRFE